MRQSRVLLYSVISEEFLQMNYISRMMHHANHHAEAGLKMENPRAEAQHVLDIWILAGLQQNI
jgi:hypothetical protein